ncbi:nucleoside diphosphate kinase regulator [Kangiella profundi]|uniref:Nucleoside diphosphate kinase regulator n=1 Tax=Kangiella profundi TaxID=1561924 RepID=A0A2K9ABL5_9GAMM|nr:nucleoside diphosphate kinase regulator [Kangiella profundi]AUD77756.1 nucleoside diphosphate kinase regulator [Kangiella profundi]GGE92890.1 nucleoside diphosphate kinase regulator [Kangiella profundi]
MSTKPSIIISSLDVERLEKILEALPHGTVGKEELETELERAEIVEPEEIPANVVTMNSTVRFKVASSDEEFEYTLVYPKDADGSKHKISILAPVGSAMLGLKEGGEIEWPKPGGGSLTVHIDQIVSQPEREGLYYR